MLLPLGGKPLVWHAWNAAVEAFGNENVVCAIPASAENDELAEVLIGFGANIALSTDPEWDVLARFWGCANIYRWHPDSVIVRVTPDDFRKDAVSLRKAAAGERPAVELGGEAFTLAMLNDAHKRIPFDDKERREHITYALFDVPAPRYPPGLWTIDTQEDYERACEMMAEKVAEKISVPPRKRIVWP